MSEPHLDPESARLLARLRFVAAGVVTGLIGLVVAVATLGPFVMADYRLDAVLLGTLVGALLALLGLVAWQRPR